MNWAVQIHDTSAIDPAGRISEKECNRQHSADWGKINQMAENYKNKQLPQNQKGIVNLLNQRIGHMQNALNEMKKAPIISILLTSVIFVFGFATQQLSAYIYEVYKPEILRSSSEMINKRLLEKSEDIEKKITEISSLITQIQSGNADNPDLLQSKINELLDGINGIKPELSEIMSLRRDLFSVAAQQKSYDIKHSGLSLNSDVTLNMFDGATICEERYTLSVGTQGNHQTTSPRIRLISPTGKSVIKHYMQTGDAIILDDELGRTTISFMRHEIVGGKALYGFNFTCPT